MNKEALSLVEQTYSQILIKDGDVTSLCTSFSALCKVCSIGSIIEVEGEKGKDTNGLHREGSDRDENTLLASKLGLLQCAPVMTSIKRLVEYAHDEKFSPQSAASALNLRDVDDLYRLDLKEIYSAHMSSPFMIVDPKKLSSLITQNKFNFNKPQDLSSWSTLINITHQKSNKQKANKDVKHPSDILQALQNDKIDEYHQFNIMGRVSSRYRVREGLLIDIIDAYKLRDGNNTSHATIKVLLPADLTNVYRTYSQLVVYGSVFKFFGIYNRGRLVVLNMTIEMSSWQQKLIEHLIQKVKEKSISKREATTALSLPNQDYLNRLLEMTSTELRWEVVQHIGLDLQEKLVNFTRGTLREEEMEVLKKYEFVRIKYPIYRDYHSELFKNTGATKPKQMPLKPPHTRLTLQHSQQMVVDLKGRDGSRWQGKKQPQLIWMIQKLEALLQNIPAYVNKEKRIKIVDIGVSIFLSYHLLSLLLYLKIIYFQDYFD